MFYSDIRQGIVWGVAMGLAWFVVTQHVAVLPAIATVALLAACLCAMAAE